MKRSVVLSLLVLLGFLTNCEKNTSSVAPRVQPRFSSLEKNVLQLSQAFGLHLLNELSQQNPGDNLFFSPFSLSCALTMVLNGANGETRQAIQQTLAVQGYSVEELNAVYRRLLQLLPYLDGQVIFLPANSLWYDASRFALNPDFAATLQTDFFATLEGINFAVPEAVSAINHWVDQSTRGRIQRIIDHISPDERLFLLNAIYFQGLWSQTFDPEKTHTATFFRSSGSPVTCQMMHRRGQFLVAQEQEVSVVDVPYGNGAYGMTLLLPAAGHSISDLLSLLNESRLAGWLEAMKPQEIVLEMPRFRFNNALRLNNALSKLGMAVAFNPGRADFLGMQASNQGRERLFLTRVQHNAFVQVDEAGTQAAAATGIGVGVTSAPPQIILNRPFLFFIREKVTGTILFLGKLEEPVWEG